MKKLLLVVFSFFIPFLAHAQHQKIDSLKKLIVTAKEDTTKTWLYYKLGSLYSHSKPDSAILFFLQEEQLSRKLNFLPGEAKSLNGEGVAFASSGNYPKALTCYLAALKINEQRGDRLNMAKNLGNISNIYNYEGDHRQSINYLQRAKSLAEAVHAERLITNNLINLGDDYEKLNILDSAKILTQQAYKFALKLAYADATGIAVNNLGNIYFKMHQLDTALHYYRKSVPYSKQAGNDENLCETTLEMATIFSRQGQPDSGLYYARQSIAAGVRGGFTASVLAASQFLTAYFEKKGRLDSAFHYQKIAIVAKDSLFSLEKTKEVQNLGEAEHQRQQDIATQQAAYQAKVRYYLLIAVIVFLLVMAFIFWRNSRQRQKANLLLESQKEEIQHTLAELRSTQTQLVQREKMASLGELTAGIAHEIQNPLNFVNNFSEVNKEMMEELKAESGKPKAERDEQLEIELINDLIENEQKINHHGKRADAIVKGMLQHSRTSTGERQLTNINTLADEFFKLSYHGLRAKDKSFNAKMVTHFDPDLSKVNIVQQDIGRVLLNLFNNAFYAVNERKKIAGDDYKPEVKVSTSSTPKEIEIKVKDNGNGIHDAIKDKIMQPFFTTKPTGEGTGLGLSVSYDIVVKGHGGSIKVESVEGEETVFTIILPI